MAVLHIHFWWQARQKQKMNEIMCYAVLPQKKKKKLSFLAGGKSITEHWSMFVDKWKLQYLITSGNQTLTLTLGEPH